MSNVIIWKLHDKDESYDHWYDFLNWKQRKSIEEVSTWDDSYYTGIIYKAYRVFDDHDLTYILLKWNVVNRGDYYTWIKEKRDLEATVYTDKDIVWVDNDS